jgi:hypothetical protein
MVHQRQSIYIYQFRVQFIRSSLLYIDHFCTYLFSSRNASTSAHDYLPHHLVEVFSLQTQERIGKIILPLPIRIHDTQRRN